MLGLGWTEMLVIGVVALIFIGPKDLPVVMGKIGKVMGQIRRMGNEFQREINRSTGLDEVRNLRSSLTDPLKKTADEIRREFNTMTPQGPKPSGALKPTDPAVESVVDDIREKAGMATPKKSNDELAKEYGFKSTTTTPTADKPVETAAPAVAEAKPTPAVVDAKAAPAAPKPARKKAEPKAPAAADGEAKPAAKKSAKPKAVSTKSPTVADGAKGDASPAPEKKPRAPRKKPADTAGKN